MIDLLKKAIQDATDTIKEQTSNLGEGAKEKTYELIEDWLQIFPKLEIYGLEVHSFALGIALSPSLEVDLMGSHGQFTRERIQQILDENTRSSAITMVFTAIKTAYAFHRRTCASQREPLIVKIKVKIAPEVKVFINAPLVA